MSQLFSSIYDLFHRRKLLFWLFFLASLGVWITLASRITLRQDIAAMMPDSEDIKTMNDVISRTETGEQIIFMISNKGGLITDPEELIEAAELLANDIQQECASWIDTIMLAPGGQATEEALVDIFRENLPIFLTEDDYQQVENFTTPEHIEARLAENRKLLLSPASVVYKRMVASDPIGITSLVWQKLQTFQTGNSYEIHEGYLFSDSGRKLNFFLKPRYKSSETGINKTFFKKLDQTIAGWEQQHPQLQTYYFGGPAVAAGNAAQMQTDTIVTLSVTILLLLALTYYFFKRKRTPLLLLVPVAYGAAMGLGIVYLIQGSLSVIALGAGAIILGIAIDFSIHFLAHARHSSNIRETVRELAHPLTVGSFTTIAAFLSLRLAETPLLNDLGLFAAASLSGAALCTLVFLPHFPLGDVRSDVRETLFDKIANRRPENNKWLLILIAVLTPVFFYFSFNIGFDNDLMNLNYLSPELKTAQEEVTKENAAALSSIFIVAQGSDEEIALQHLEQVAPVLDSLAKTGQIKSVNNPTMLLPSIATQNKRIERWRQYWTEERKNKILASVHTAAARQGFSAHAFNDFATLLNASYEPITSENVELLKRLYPAGFAQNANDHYVISSVQVPADHRTAVLERMNAEENIIVTDRQQGATRLLEILNNDFNGIALYSSLIVFFALLIGYGRIELALMSFLPMAISWVWILGIMSLLGLQFNVVNIIISTLIFGLGDDYTIFTTDGLVEKYKSGTNRLKSVRASVYLSVVTVIIGLGVLLLAKHPALKSIAFISVVGILCVVFISQTIQPALFNWFIQNRANKKYMPFTLWSFTKSTFAFFYFFTGSMVLTVLGILFTKLWPFNKEKGKYWLHVWISRYTWSMMYIMANVRKRVINRHLGDFSKPAVYVANHSSFLDILCTTMLHPKLVLLTNKWVWRSPVFGAVVRMADYYPVAEGAEDSLTPLSELVRQGYSIVVFPEGTRSVDGRINRFHKGAFFIAEKLKLDIVPLVLHGIHYTMQKGDWLLKDGTTSIYFYPRITPEDTSFGLNYSERAKQIGRWMRQTLAAIQEREETPTYFREQLIRSYTYKGPVLEWYCRVKTKLEQNYESFHSILPRQGKFYDLGCGYGFMSYMLHWAAPKREFIGVDYDQEKIDTAQNNYLRDDGIQFLQADLTNFTPTSCDGIIISDVLHYLLPEQQEQLLNRCTEALSKGGLLIIRDGVPELGRRHITTRLTEIFSTKIFNFNKTQNDLHFISRSFIENYAKRANLTLHVVDPKKATSNIVFVLKKQ